MGLVRFRYGYMNGDLDRINVQHDFLKAAAEQFLSQGSIPNASKVISILAGSMDTNLTAANMAYFARQLMMCSSEDIEFLYRAEHSHDRAESELHLPRPL